MSVVAGLGTVRAGAGALAGAVARKVGQQPHAEPGGALVGEIGAAHVVGGAGDVEVRPRHLAGEVVQELAGGERGRLALRGRC